MCGREKRFGCYCFLLSAHRGSRSKNPQNLFSKSDAASAPKPAEGGQDAAEGRVLTQQWGEPVDVGFTVRVQKGDDASFGGVGAQQAGPDQALPLVGPQNANLGQPDHVLLQRLLEVL